MARRFARAVVGRRGALAAARVERKCESCESEDLKQRAATGHRFGELVMSEPGDASERDAERMAQQAYATLTSRGAGAPVVPSVLGGARLQRAVDEQAAASPGGFIVDDEAAALLPGQMRKGEFLRTLRAEACAAADRELARVGRGTEGCPYLARWFDYYEQRDARQVERALRKYAPPAARATSAAGYIPIVSAHAAQAARQWAQTGALPELPEGTGAAMMGGGLLGAIGSAIGGALSAIGSLFFKAESGGARGGVDRGALESRLGPGQPLECGAQARMSAAFGYDFSRVRVHADHHAAQAASGLNARAFTLGNHVAFAAGQYRPGHPVGDALLAHELAHVVQQSGAVAPSAAGLNPALEEDADTAAASAVIGLWGTGRARDQLRERKPQLRSRLRLQRCNQQRMPSNIGVARPPTEAMAEVPIQAKSPAKPPLEGFAAAFPDAAALIKQSPSALAFVKQAETSGALFGGYTEDEGGKSWPFTRQRTVFIPRSQTDPVEAMSSFLFELNNAMRASQFADISSLADRGKLDARKYARMKVAVEVEGMLALAELWVKMKTEMKGDYSKRDKDFYLSEYNDYKAGRLSKDQIINRVLQERSGEDPSKTTELYYMDMYYEMQKRR